MNNFKTLVIALLLVLPLVVISQNPDNKINKLKANKELNKSFNKFYIDSVRQETKDEWGEPCYYKVDQINGVHNLDYNKDGAIDSLVEFSVYSSDGGTWYFLVAVLFKNVNGIYKYIAHVDPRPTGFDKYQNSFFYFSGSDFPNSKIEYKK